MTAAEAVAQAVETLKAAGVDEPARDARRLLAHAMGVEASRLTLILPDEISPAAASRFDDLVDQRARRVPVSQLTGQRAFYGRTFMVNADVLDPRPDTEALIDAALDQPFARVLDLGTGSGCIILTLLAETGAEVYGIGTDLSREALAVAMVNAGQLGLEHRVKFYEGDWFAALPVGTAAFDLIVGNPPYITADEMLELSPEVRDFEPRMALTDEGDGLSCYRAIAKQAQQHLREGGRLIVEVGARQGAAVAQIFGAQGFAEVTIKPDLDGRDRVVFGQKPRIIT